jgi:Uncharacterized protein conserved in bacteria
MTAVLELLERSAPAVQVDGSPLAADWTNALISLRIQRGLCIVSRATLRFADPGYALAGKTVFGLGTKVDIGLSDGTSLFSGVVTGAALEQSASSHPELAISVDDLGYKLALGTRIETYQQMSYSDVAQQIVGKHGMTADVDASRMTSPNEYLLQSGTDLAFVDELTRRAGCVWWVDDRSLKIRAAGTSAGDVNVTLGQTLTDFSLRASGLRPTEVVVRGWDVTAQQDVVAQSDSNKDPLQIADSDFISDYLGDRPGNALVSAQQQAGDSNPNDTDEAGTLAFALYSDWYAGAVVARGSGTVNVAIKPLVTVVVADAGPASGRYLVSEVEHVYRHDGFFTRFVAGPIRPTGLVDTLGRSRPDPGFAISGLLTAKVSNSRDPENQGRVKVTYAGVGGTVESAWARVVALGGGTSRGTVFTPEPGDEVLVGFERGDSRHPVVIGGLYSSKNAIPADDELLDGSSKVAYRRITSRLGHVIELADGTGATSQHVLLKIAGGEQSVRVGADRVDVKAAAGKPIAVQSGDAKFEIDASGNITISGNQISIKAQTELTLQGVTVGVKGSGPTSVEGATVDVKGQATASVSGGGQLSLKGGLVMIN